MAKRVETAVGIGLGMILMVALLSVAGCKGRELKQAKKDAREAKTTATRLQLQLNQVVQNHDALKDELNVVRETRDELQKLVDGLAEERDNASVLAQQAKQEIANLSSRAAGQTSEQASLQKEIEELKALVVEQQALIETLQAGASAEPNITDLPADPNEVVEEILE